MAKFFNIIKLAQDTTSGGGVSPARNNSNRPRKPNSAPPIPTANIPNIRPKPISEKDLLTTRYDSALGEKTAGFAAIKQDMDYGKYLLKHKYNMLGPGRQLGISYKTLLGHDMDKFQPKRYRLYSD